MTVPTLTNQPGHRAGFFVAGVLAAIDQLPADQLPADQPSTSPPSTAKVQPPATDHQLPTTAPTFAGARPSA